MSWGHDLTQEQKDAASHYGSHACLLAGPGTGKTRSLTRHILFLIMEQNIDPSKITVLTFTRAAAAELRERIKNKLVEGSSLPVISTLHSFALKTLLKNPARDRLPLPLRIASDYEEDKIIYADMQSTLGLYKKDVSDLFNQLSADWETLSADSPDWESRFPDPRFLGTWQEHRNIYGYVLRSELVYQLKRSLEEGDLEHPPTIDYLLVDEYQDLNACDLAVINYLTENGAELYIAGDDDQSIYGFRYANPEGIRRFHSEYSPSQPLELSLCMRCDRKILDYSLFVAKQDPRRINKNLHCKPNAADGEVKILRFKGQRKEAEGIASLCKDLIENKDILPSKILILLRSDKDQKFSSVIVKSLSDLNIPVNTLSNPLKSLETPEGSYLISILRLLVHRDDNLAWRNILQVRRNNIGDVKISEIYNLASNLGVEFAQVIEKLKIQPEIIPRDGIAIQNEIINIEEMLNNLNYGSNTNIPELISDLTSEIITDDEDRNEIITIFDNILLYQRDVNLEKILDMIFVSLSDKEQETDSENISIMTMHQAKGLTADAVFIAAAEDEYIPGNDDTQEKIEDARRLLYVSLTRAKHYLFITHCQRRTYLQRHSGRNSGQTRRTLSRFLSGGPIPSIPANRYIENLN